MPTPEQRIADLERLVKAMTPQVNLAYKVAAALQGRQADATLVLPHNDSWLFEDNVDGTHPANLRYIIAANTERIVSARLSIHLAPYRTYNSFSIANTGNESGTHTHGSAAHSHEMWATGGTVAAPIDVTYTDGLGVAVAMRNSAQGTPASYTSFSTTPGNTGPEGTNHTHPISGSSTLGVTEGATAAGVTLSFDGGPDVSPKFGGPFSTDQIELNVAPYLVTTRGVWHTIAMQPNGLGRIEAHLRLGVYVSAAQPI